MIPLLFSLLCITIVYDDLLWNALVVERALKHFDHVHTFHRSTSSVGLAGADGEFPVTRAATELMHDLRRKKHYDFPCFVASFIVRGKRARNDRRCTV